MLLSDIKYFTETLLKHFIAFSLKNIGYLKKNIKFEYQEFFLE